MTYEILHLEHISKHFSVKPILDDVALTLNQGERHALVGENGAGKTTLARIIMGTEPADSGIVRFAPQTRVGYLPQEITTIVDLTIEHYIAQAVGDLQTLEAQMRVLETQLENAEALQTYGDLHDLFMRRGGYDLPYRTAQIFEGLGIAYLDRTRSVMSLSGGEKTRVHLASLLLQEPDLLVLDEPTNHLDFAGVAWLEKYLVKYPHGLLLITHDRTFIDRVATHIVELSATTHRLTTYHGNYGDYLAQREQRYQREMAEFEAQRDEMIRLKRIVQTTTHNSKQNYEPTDGDKLAFNTHKATAEKTRSKTIRDAKQRLDEITRDKLTNPSHHWRIDFQFQPVLLVSPQPIVLENLTKHFGERVILDHLNTQVNKGERVVLVAPNGTGKTTLLRIIAGLMTADTGRVIITPSARVGYLDQEGETLDPEQGVLACYREVLPSPLSDNEIMAELHRTGLFADTTLPMKRVKDLSVGQRRKLGLARLIASKANVLLLDEPTNHLDLPSLEALEANLKTFAGAILAVSHDRRFVENVATQVWQIEGGRVTAHTQPYEFSNGW